jgi:hypothetical protein
MNDASLPFRVEGCVAMWAAGRAVMGGAAAAAEPVAAVRRAAAAVAAVTWAAVSPPRATTGYSATRPGSARAPVSTELGNGN